jgi:hypothetical protein
MNCNECKNLLIEYIEDLLDAARKRDIEKHLEECPVCMKEAENMQALQARLVQNTLAYGPIDLEDKVMDRILKEQTLRLKDTDSAGFLFQIRSLFMKNMMVKIAAVAAVVIAVFIGLNSFQNNITFAQVVEPVLNARTIAYDIVFGDPAKGVAVHDIVMDRRIRRSFSNIPTVLIIDSENKRMLALSPSYKGAAYLDIDGMIAENNRDFLNFVRNAIRHALDDRQSAVEELGREKINGMETTGFKLSSESGHEEIVIWADSDTAFPIQINIRVGESVYTISNIQFDIPVDESLVSMEVPAGYIFQDQKIDMTKFSEKDFLTVLEIYAAYLDGSFPDKLAFEDILKLVSELGNVIPRMNLKPEEMREIGNTYARGMMFFQNLATGGAEHSYTGKGVRFGEGDREVFRYRATDSQSYRVIYGDLHVEDIPAENLPQ